MTAACRERVAVATFAAITFASVLAPTWYVFDLRLALSAMAFMAGLLIVLGILAWATGVWIERGD